MHIMYTCSCLHGMGNINTVLQVLIKVKSFDNLFSCFYFLAVTPTTFSAIGCLETAHGAK